ncbi:MAG TPA: GAF domain-containing protein, partial [Longimicrobiaceae bacterium]
QARVEELREWLEAASRALADREARLDAILEGAPAGIVLMDADTFTVREANPAYYGFLEGEWRAPGSILGRRFDEFIPRFEELGTAALFRRVAETGEPFEAAEYEFAGFERGVTWFRWTLKPLQHRPDGRPRYLLLLMVEITEQVAARRAAEAERRALYDVVEALPVGVVVAEAPDGRIVFMNPAAVELGGRPPSELAADGADQYTARWRILTPTGDSFPPEQLPLTRAVAGETVREVEMVLERPDGTQRTIVTTGVPLRDAQGRVARGVASFFDVTDRLRLEQALLARTREAEEAAGDAGMRAEESRALREMGRALVSVLDPEHVLRMAGAHAMELLAAEGSVVATPDRERDVVRFGPALGSFAELEGTEFPLSGSMAERVMAEGHTLVVNDPEAAPRAGSVLPPAERMGLRSAVLVPIRAYGETLGILGALNRAGGFGEEHARLLEALADSAALAVHNARVYATERRRAEENRALLAAAEALTSTLDPGEVMERIAGLAQELTGAEGAGVTVFAGEDGSRLRTPVGVGLLEAFRGMESERAGSLSDRAAAAERPFVLRVAELEGDYAGYFREMGVSEFAMVPLRTGGEVFGVLGVVATAESRPFDGDDLRVLSLLGDQAALAVRNARTYEAAQAASHAKSEFLAMMSHELRTPLNALEGYASLLEDGIYGPLNDAQRGALERMRSSRRHLMALIEQVLDMARLEAGRKRVEAEETDLRVLALEVAEALRGAAERKGLEMETEVDGVGRALTDAGMVRQVLTNLLGNAIKFTERGRIVLRAHGDGEHAVVEVTDTGPGIAPEHHERIFES